MSRPSTPTRDSWAITLACITLRVGTMGNSYCNTLLQRMIRIFMTQTVWNDIRLRDPDDGAGACRRRQHRLRYWFEYDRLRASNSSMVAVEAARSWIWNRALRSRQDSDHTPAAFVMAQLSVRIMNGVDTHGEAHATE